MRTRNTLKLQIQQILYVSVNVYYKNNDFSVGCPEGYNIMLYRGEPSLLTDAGFMNIVLGHCDIG